MTDGRSIYEILSDPTEPETPLAPAPVKRVNGHPAPPRGNPLPLADQILGGRVPEPEPPAPAPPAPPEPPPAPEPEPEFTWSHEPRNPLLPDQVIRGSVGSGWGAIGSGFG